MTPIVKVWCLPADLTEGRLRNIHEDILRACICIPELGIHAEKDLTVLFPKDMMKYGLGSEIVIEISIPSGPAVTQKMCRTLVELVALAIAGSFPKATIQCQIITFNIADVYYSPAP